MKKYDELYDLCTQLCGYIGENENDKLLKNIRDDLKGISRGMLDVEKEFIESYREFIEFLDPNTKDWQIYKNHKDFKKRNLGFLDSDEAIIQIAELEMERIAKLAGANASELEIKKNAQILIYNFRVHLILHKEILKRFIISGCDLSKKNRSNWFWDMQLVACVHTNSDREALVLVTSDKDILKAAEKSGNRDKVIRLSGIPILFTAVMPFDFCLTANFRLQDTQLTENITRLSLLVSAFVAANIRLERDARVLSVRKSTEKLLHSGVLQRFW